VAAASPLFRGIYPLSANWRPAVRRGRVQRERERARESFIRNNLRNGVVSAKKA